MLLGVLVRGQHKIVANNIQTKVCYEWRSVVDHKVADPEVFYEQYFRDRRPWVARPEGMKSVPRQLFSTTCSWLFHLSLDHHADPHYWRPRETRVGRDRLRKIPNILLLPQWTREALVSCAYTVIDPFWSPMFTEHLWHCYWIGLCSRWGYCTKDFRIVQCAGCSPCICRSEGRVRSIERLFLRVFWLPCL